MSFASERRKILLSERKKVRVFRPVIHERERDPFANGGLKKAIDALSGTTPTTPSVEDLLPIGPGAFIRRK